MNRQMDKKLTIYTKIVGMIMGLLIPVMALFAYSNQTAVRVIEDEMKTNNLNKLRFLHQQMEGKIDQLSMNSIAMSNDASIRELEFRQLSGTGFDRDRLLRMILDNINLQSGISGWMTDITVYSRLTKEMVSTSSASVDLKETLLLREITKGWTYVTESNGKKVKPEFVYFAVDPINAYDRPETAKLIVRTSFSPSYLQDMLDQYKANGQGDPFLYHPQYGVIGNRTLNEAGSQGLIRQLGGESLEEARTHFTVDTEGRQSLASYLKLGNLGWYLVDYVPMEDILTPVTKTRNFFYGSTLLLLLLSLFAAYMLYRNVQVPIRVLIRHVQRIQKGDYGTRVRFNGGAEFAFLFERFNDMTEQIQDLLEKVYAERLRSREAVLKQLQSQINPHFLYNCLFFIKNTARMGDEEAVVAMALNLGEYFRYTTRLANQSANLAEELSVVTNYLEIQNLRMRRIAYEIDVPEEMKALRIPRLMLQPLVENAVLHGIEPKPGRGTVRITGEAMNGEYRVYVEDDGAGMEPEQLERMQRYVNRSENEDDGGFGFGLWNVNQRIKLMYGEGSGLFFSPGGNGGVRVTVTLYIREGEDHVPAADCG
ncbi:histidine kinase [Paenibacillus aurantius]|uniref:histidine kinase n=1 Tax=Paenibacillus aurantius TaxID=2918900 RepID=A0AA96REY2_9BACL|nr:histidine kinase [Paenibacillus aurantius]WNQ12955.1 histidine kinase [Paenibacillus aurantius]